ncbi:MAG: hypothetical protein KJ056_05830 [Acidimicrobiia bacterium]|nr:hypothetical protein [Acidimicrobiia bacterium]
MRAGTGEGGSAGRGIGWRRYRPGAEVVEPAQRHSDGTYELLLLVGEVVRLPPVRPTP